MNGRFWRTTLMATAMLAIGTQAGYAQSSTAPISNSQRDCQTVLQCNFTRNGVYRGCISAYTCRRCRLVRARNCGPTTQGRRTCRRLVCTWG